MNNLEEKLCRKTRTSHIALQSQRYCLYVWLLSRNVMYLIFFHPTLASQILDFLASLVLNPASWPSNVAYPLGLPSWTSCVRSLSLQKVSKTCERWWPAGTPFDQPNSIGCLAWRSLLVHKLMTHTTKSNPTKSQTHPKKSSKYQVPSVSHRSSKSGSLVTGLLSVILIILYSLLLCPYRLLICRWYDSRFCAPKRMKVWKAIHVQARSSHEPPTNAQEKIQFKNHQ